MIMVKQECECIAVFSRVCCVKLGQREVSNHSMCFLIVTETDCSSEWDLSSYSQLRCLLIVYIEVDFPFHSILI
jgi:hypothetical protein